MSENTIYSAPKTAELFNESENNSGMGQDTYPKGVKGWSWGGMCFSWIWGPFNGTFVALLALIPYLGFIVAFWLGFNGRKMAWRNKRWESVEHFNAVQRRWSIAAAVIYGIMILGIIAAVALPAYQSYIERAGG